MKGLSHLTSFTDCSILLSHKCLLIVGIYLKIISLRRKSYNVNDKLIAWIRDFLCRFNRKQSIGLFVNGEFSTWSEVLSDIPRGSILGPLLFLIYINDLPDLCALQYVYTGTRSLRTELLNDF